jgi:acetyl-CoA carboxylase carboxyltransferase component
MTLSGAARYEGHDLVGFTPKGSVVGMAKLDGRKVVVNGGDFTVRGGSAGGGDRGAMGQELSATQRALEWRLPFVRLLDAAGGSVRSFEYYGRTYLPDGNAWTIDDVQLMSTSPVVSAVLGSVAGLPAIQACLAHFNVMVRGISQIFPGGPPVVKAALGYDITKEDLGGEHIHVRESGCIDNLAETEEDAFDQIRKFLSYLPSSVHEMAPRGPAGDDPARAEPELLSFVPRDRRKPYDGRKLIKLVVDKDSFFEIAPDYGRARVTGLARINGYPVAIMANNPRHNGGTTDVAAGNKMVRMIQLCDTFHLPLISLADETGFMVGLQSEKQGIERAGAKLVSYVCNSRMPWITIVIGRLFGVAGQCHHRPTGMFRRYAWPSASWGSMHISGGASAAYRAEIENAPDPDAKRQEIEDRLNAIASPFRTAEATGQDIIDPRETRAMLCEFVEDAQRILASQLGPPPIPFLP